MSRHVTPLDMLATINELNRTGPRLLAGINPAPPYLDVSRDLLLTPLDVLLVISYLNQAAVGEGEGEAGSLDSERGNGGWASALPWTPVTASGTHATRPSDRIAPAGADADSRQSVPPLIETSRPASWNYDGERRLPVTEGRRIEAGRSGSPQVENLENVLADLAGDARLPSRPHTTHDRALLDMVDSLERVTPLSG